MVFGRFLHLSRGQCRELRPTQIGIGTAIRNLVARIVDDRDFV